MLTMMTLNVSPSFTVNTMHTLLLLVTLTCAVSLTVGAGFTPCSGSDCIIYRADYASCTEVTRSRTNDCRWVANFNRRVDETILGGAVVAYKIRWFSGAWSDWFVPGQNDIDQKFNPSTRKCAVPYLAKSIRRRWANFYDHTHKYIICK